MVIDKDTGSIKKAPDGALIRIIYVLKKEEESCGEQRPFKILQNYYL